MAQKNCVVVPRAGHWGELSQNFKFHLLGFRKANSRTDATISVQPKSPAVHFQNFRPSKNGVTHRAIFLETEPKIVSRPYVKRFQNRSKLKHCLPFFRFSEIRQLCIFPFWAKKFQKNGVTNACCKTETSIPPIGWHSSVTFSLLVLWCAELRLLTIPIGIDQHQW